MPASPSDSFAGADFASHWVSAGDGGVERVPQRHCPRPPVNITNQTLREVVHEPRRYQIRIVLSNVFARLLTIGLPISGSVRRRQPS